MYLYTVEVTVLHVQRPHSQVVEPCMVDVIKASSPVPKLFQFFAALQYQLHFFLNKADVSAHTVWWTEGHCVGIRYDMLSCWKKLIYVCVFVLGLLQIHANSVNASIDTDYSLLCNPGAERCNWHQYKIVKWEQLGGNTPPPPWGGGALDPSLGVGCLG